MKAPSLFLIFFLTLAICACENPWMAEILESKTVTFNSNGGSHVSSQTLLKGERIQRPADPTKNGFDFAGWYTDNESFYEPYDFDYVPIMSMILHANWDPILVFINSSELEEFLSGQLINTPSNPYIIKLNINDANDMEKIKETLTSDENTGKYVILDFSDSTITSIRDHIFSNCYTLTGVILPNVVTNIGNGVFEGCENLTTINVNNNNTYSSKDGVLYNQDGTILIACPSGKTGLFIIPDSVINIGDYAFPNCSKLTGITIGKNVAAIGDYAFHSCISLTNVTIPDSVKNIGDRAFYYCTNLNNATIGKNVETIGDYAFYLCLKLNSVTFEDNIEADKFAESAFDDELYDVIYTPNNIEVKGTYKKDNSGSWYKL